MPTGSVIRPKRDPLADFIIRWCCANGLRKKKISVAEMCRRIGVREEQIYRYLGNVFGFNPKTIRKILHFHDLDWMADSVIAGVCRGVPMGLPVPDDLLDVPSGSGNKSGHRCICKIRPIGKGEGRNWTYYMHRRPKRKTKHENKSVQGKLDDRSGSFLPEGCGAKGAQDSS